MNDRKTPFPKRKNHLVLFVIWLIAGVAMVITGIFVLFNRNETISAVSGILGLCALIAGVLTVVVRMFQAWVQGRKKFSVDFLIWFLAAYMLFDTDILNKLGKAAFIIIGFVILVEGIRAFCAAFAAKDERHWLVPRIIFSVVFMILGLIVIFNAERIFTGMTVFSIGIFFIVHGFSILVEWFERAKDLYENGE